MLSSQKTQNITHSISRATDILLCLSRFNNTVTGIAEYCHLSVSTVHRILKTLEELNWVRQDRVSRNYFLGPLITELASNTAACHQYLIVNSMNEMLRLSAITGETINLGTMIDLNYFRLHEIPSRHNLRIMEGSPYGLPIKGATGKVMLSQLKDEEIKKALRAINAQKDNEYGQIDIPLFIKEIDEIRRNGYGTSFGEIIPGGACISVPIKHYTYPVALSIMAPESRMRTQMASILRELKVSAGRISSGNLVVLKGGPPPSP